MIATIVDINFSLIPNIETWEDHFALLRDKKHEGFYWRSPIYVPPVGLEAIFEGQARFSQLQFLNGSARLQYSCDALRKLGYFEGVYVEAFNKFLELSDSSWPVDFDDPIVGLFLLICDIAINPTRGFPLNIEDYENLIDDVDVGVRFYKLCLAVKDLPHLKIAIREYSKEEYIQYTEQLTIRTGYDAPRRAFEVIKEWTTNSQNFKDLMEEHRTFRFDLANMPVRVFFSHFISLSLDRLDKPEFFCWPGKCMTGQYLNEDIRNMWLRHLSLFSDRPDKTGVYPRNWPNRDVIAIKETFLNFYTNVILYDLTRQWILFDGPFIRDYRWLFENYSQKKADEWSDNIFEQVYGVSLNDFEISSSNKL